MAAQLLAQGEETGITRYVVREQAIPALDYPGTVFGVGASSPVPDIARRYARGLALHHRDRIVPDERHLLAPEDAR
jgi:hypothetical protein